MKRLLVVAAGALLILGLLSPARPAFATTPSGALLNPSTGGPGTIVSSKKDGTDSLYHFTVRAVPTTAGATISFVRIQIQPPDAGTFVTIGNATEVGTTETWELEWDQSASGIAEGKDGKVRALIQDSNGETASVPSDQGLTVHFDNTAPTVEMTDPADGGSLGFFSGDATIRGTSSADTNEIGAFYTTSQPNEAQKWTDCSGGPQPISLGGGTWSLTCSLQGTDTAAQVAAVAAVPFSDIPIPRTKGAGDAHRVSTFGVQPNSVTISPSSSSQTVGDCQLFTLQILDTLGNNLPGKAIDIHAIGPANNVFFASVSGKTDPFTAPSNPTAHDSYETTDTCNKNNVGSGGGTQPAGPGQSGVEGIHTGSTPHPKHIDGQTTANGFTFALASHSAGTTAIQAWYDVNGNDQNDNPSQQCPTSGSGELCGTASVTWETPTVTSVTLTPTQDSAPVGKSHKVTSQVIDQHGNPMSGQTVSFAVTGGPNSSQDLDSNGSTPPGYFGFCVAGADGCSRTYTDLAQHSGTDLIKAFIDQDGDLAPGSTEPQASAQQEWVGEPTTTPTSLSIHPNTTQTINSGEAVRFHGRLVSSDKSCVLHEVVVLFNRSGPVARSRIKQSDLHQKSNGDWAGSYRFVRRPSHTQFFHTAFEGTSNCHASRAPKSGGVKVAVT